MRTKFVGTVDEAVEALRDSDSQTRVDAAWMLSELGEEAAPALPALILALRDEEFGVVSYACDALRHVGKNSNEVIQELRRLDSSKNAAIKGVAKETLLALERPDLYEKKLRGNRIACATFVIGGVLLLVALVYSISVLIARSQ